jgi:hypothetical protein
VAEMSVSWAPYEGYTKHPSINTVLELPKHPVVFFHFGDEQSIRKRVAELFDEVGHAEVVIAVHVRHGLK